MARQGAALEIREGMKRKPGTQVQCLECERREMRGIALKKAMLYIHGKGGDAQEADHYREICAQYEVIGLDYAAWTPWENREEIRAAFDDLNGRFDRVAVTANSIGAFFAMHALADRPVERAFFISPIVNMEKLICDMMGWAGVDERELRERGEIETTFGETLSWKYLSYVRAHPISWMTPTHILYGEGDNLTSYETVRRFSEESGATLTVMRGGEHWFHTPEEMAFLDAWMQRWMDANDGAGCE